MTAPQDTEITLPDALAELFALEPVESYPLRVAKALGGALSASTYEVHLATHERYRSPGEAAEHQLELPLKLKKRDLGKLTFTRDEPFTDASRGHAKSAAAAFARGLHYVAELARVQRPKTQDDLDEILSNTPLTPRERDVVGRLLSGATTVEIASATGLAVSTVNTYIKRLFNKLGVHSRVELVAQVLGTRRGPPRR